MAKSSIQDRVKWLQCLVEDWAQEDKTEGYLRGYDKGYETGREDALYKFMEHLKRCKDE